MEIRNLITFLKVAELGNITHAAEQLGYVQSTVSMQIQHLESEIGLPLFDRIGKKIFLTPFGAELVSYAGQIVQLSDRALTMGKSSAEIGGILRVGVVESLFMWKISNLIPFYHERFPNVLLQVKIASGHELIDLLCKNELDLIFLLDQNISEYDFTLIFTNKEKLVFVTHPQNPLAESGSVSLREIISEPLILTEQHSIYRKALENVTLSQRLVLSPIIEVNNTSVIVKLLKRKMGVSFLPQYTVQDSVNQKKLSIIDTNDLSIEFHSQLFYHKNKWVTQQMQGFIELIKKHFEYES